MARIGKGISTYLPISHVPKESVNAPQGLRDVESDTGKVWPMSPTQAIGHPIVCGGESMNAIGFGPSRRASTATGQKVVNLLHELRIVLQLGMSAK